MTWRGAKKKTTESKEVSKAGIGLFICVLPVVACKSVTLELVLVVMTGEFFACTYRLLWPFAPTYLWPFAATPLTPFSHFATMGALLLAVLLYHANSQFLNVSRAVFGHSFEPDRDVVLVTGGVSGLGKEIVVKYASKGATVVVLDVYLPKEEERVASVHYYQCDVSDRKQVIACQQRIKKEVGIVSILINNAGITSGKTVLELSYEDIERTVQINLLASFYTIKIFLPDMLAQRRGYVVTIASVLGYMLPARLSAYGASKSGLIALHESLTYELGPPSISPQGVKTLLVCPGQLKTRLFGGVRTPWRLLAPELEPSYVAQKVLSATELGRRGEIKVPLYGHLLPVMRAVPWPVMETLRYYLGVDESMRTFKGAVEKAAAERASSIYEAVESRASLVGGSRVSIIGGSRTSTIGGSRMSLPEHSGACLAGNGIPAEGPTLG